MKISNIVLGVFLVLPLNNFAYAAGNTKTKDATKECPLLLTTSAYISFKTTSQNVDLGKLYENYTNEVKALPKTGHFNNFKIISQNFRTEPMYGSAEGKQVSIDFTVEFDLNYQAVTDLASLKVSDVSVNTFERQHCI